MFSKWRLLTSIIILQLSLLFGEGEEDAKTEKMKRDLKQLFIQSIFLVLTIFKTQFFGNRFPNIFLHFFGVKVQVTFVKDNRMFLNCDRKFLFVSCHFVFDFFTREAINKIFNQLERDCAIIVSFFPSLPLPEFPFEQKFLLARKYYAKAYERRKVVRKSPPVTSLLKKPFEFVNFTNIQE